MTALNILSNIFILVGIFAVIFFCVDIYIDHKYKYERLIVAFITFMSGIGIGMFS